MENEKLSQSFIQKYDPLADNFVIVENLSTTETFQQNQKQRRFEPFSFFRFRNRETKSLQNDPPPALPEEPPTAQIPPPLPQPIKPQPMPPTNSVILAKDIYNKLKILSSLYQTMVISDPSNASVYNSLISETAILENTMLAIYQLLSGNNFIPTQNQTSPILTGNICNDLVIVQSYLQSIIDDVIALQRSVNVSNVDRQLTIINATLFSQKSKLSTLQSTCGV